MSGVSVLQHFEAYQKSRVAFVQVGEAGGGGGGGVTGWRRVALLLVLYARSGA